jgi:subtilisin family serine protease
MYGLTRAGVTEAWATTTGSATVIVADLDTGADYAHSDLYLNIWLNQGEIPFPIGGANGIVEDPDDDDGIITFRDLNLRHTDATFANSAFVSDLNSNGYIDGEDLIFDARWSNNVDDDRNGYVDDIVGWDFANNDNDPYDYHGHGTHTAGTIGAISDNGIGVTGVNWSVQIMVIKIFTDTGGGATNSVIAEGLRYAVDNGARISNNSYGGTFGSNGDPLYEAIAYANSQNHLFIAAAGNESVNNDSSSGRSYPASYTLPNIISVAATDSTDRLAAFSNYGATSVDIAAPGVSIYSTVPDGYAAYSGTSMAAPHVTGAAALLLSINPNLTVTELKDILLRSADAVSDLSGKVLTASRLNVSEAVAITPTLSSNPSGKSPEVFFDAPHSATLIGPVAA